MAGELHRNGADLASLLRLLGRYDCPVKFTVYCPNTRRVLYDLSLALLFLVEARAFKVYYGVLVIQGLAFARFSDTRDWIVGAWVFACEARLG